MYSQNVRGLKTKLDEFSVAVTVVECDVVALTETWLDTSVLDAELFDSTWTVLRRDRQSRRGGGVLLAARSPVTIERQHQWETPEGEDIWARVEIGKSEVYVCLVYLSPSSKMVSMNGPLCLYRMYAIL